VAYLFLQSSVYSVGLADHVLGEESIFKRAVLQPF